MRIRYTIISWIFSALIFSLFAQEEAKLSVSAPQTGELIVVIQSAFHTHFGVACPMTYKLSIPANSNNLIVMERHSSSEAWGQMTEKTSSDTFNLIEAVRFDYTKNMAYVSAAFSGATDSLFMEVLDSNRDLIAMTYEGISKYYDNRQAAVTVTFDDWEDWNALRVPPLIHLFRSHGLYLTGAVITGYCAGSTWREIQREADSGYVEVASHSRTHPETPYADPVGEVNGSYDDIVKTLTLPWPFNINGKNYVYCWIAPYGDYDSTVDSLMQISGYLAPRIYANLDTANPREYIYGDSTFSTWDSLRDHFNPFYPTVEFGAPSWGGGDTSVASLDSLFDKIIKDGDVYHCMWHPQVLDSDINKNYLISHLNYISGRKNIWYVNLGILYLYHLVQMENSTGVITEISKNSNAPVTFNLSQNYPNPFNPSTTIKYSISADVFVSENSDMKVTLTVYDMLGRKVITLLNKDEPPGNYIVNFNGDNLSSGVYFYQLKAGKYIQTKKMILLK
jgi:Secretion system C-terminal sorting domain/Polysaccharide deacetylase